MNLAAILLIMVIWSTTGEKHVFVEILPDVETCQKTGKDFYQQAMMETGTLSGAAWECEIYTTESFKRGA